MMFGLLSSVARGTGSVAVRAVSFGAGTAWNVGQALVGPVAAVGHDLVGITPRLDGRPAPTPRVVWSSGRRLHLDVGPPPGALPRVRAEALESAARTVPGVAQAHVEPALGRLVVALEHDDQAGDVARRVVTALRDAVSGEVCGGTPAEPYAAGSWPSAQRGAGDPVRGAPGSGARSSVAVPLVAAAMDLAAVAGAVAGKLGRFPAAPRATRAAVAVLRHQPRVVALLRARLGPVGADMVLTAATAAAHGWGRAPAVPLLDLAQRVGQLGEMLAYRQAWVVWEPVLAAVDRPRSFPSPAATVNPASKGPPAPDAGIVPPAVVGSPVPAAPGGGGGQIESYLDQAASGSLVAAAGALLASGDSEDVAGAVLAGVPKAAQLGREAFATVLGRGLARRGLLVLDPEALRRLDQVAVVLIDGAALRGDHRMVLSAFGGAPGWDEERVYEVGDSLLHGETAPEPDSDEASAVGARLRWGVARQAAAGAPGHGRARAELVMAGQVVGELEIGWEPDPYALALMETARRTGARVVLREVPGTAELATSVAATYDSVTGLADLVASLRAAHGPVLLVSAVHPDFARADTLSALAAADVSVALDDPAGPAAWTADVVTTAELAEAVRVLSALPAARRVSAAAVRLAKAGSTLEGLLLTAGGPTGSPGWLSVNRWMSPVNTTAAIALGVGAAAAREVLGLPDPTAVPLTAWHALDPEVVFTRLSGGPAPLADPPTIPAWRRRLSELVEQDTLAPLRSAVSAIAQLTRATRAELNDPLTPVLAVGAAASAMLGSGIDATLVTTVMAVNALIGGVQRLRAEHAVAQLFAEQDQLARRVSIPALSSTSRRLAAARGAARTQTIPARRLRPGNVIDLRAPDVVPADARLLTATDLEVDESSLTGESLPVPKHTEQTPAAQLSERAGMVFEGSTVIAGTARAIVVATGAATAARRAIATVADVDPAVGVAARLGELTSKVLPLTLAGGVVVSAVSLLNRQPLRQAVADGVAIAVTAVPEGLPMVATVAQLAAARRLAARGVLVRAPRAIEALGRVDTVCFDKTGTLTENTLRVTTAAGPDWNPACPPPRLPDASTSPILRAAARACPQPDNYHGHAHATDEAILQASVTPGEAWQVLEELPFESSRGYAAAIGIDTAAGHHTEDDGAVAEPSRLLVVKGAPEVVLDRCSLTDSAAATAETITDTLAAKGLRVLAVAQRVLRSTDLPEVPTTATDTADGDEAAAQAVDNAATQLELVGFVGIADTLRPSAIDLVGQLPRAGREVVLITGDHPVTATAIAAQLGLPTDAKVITGAQLAELDEAGQAALARDGRIFARVSPEQKGQIIHCLRRAGRVCAMVGDGANDAAAIRMAAVGIGISNRGSSAARGAADLVLTGDDLTVLLDALVEGRNMWASVRDALVILLGGNAGEVAFTIAGTILGGRAPISTRQLLLVNLLTDMFPALAVAVTPQQPPPGTVADPRAYRGYRQEVLTTPTPSLDRPLVTAIASRGAATAAAATAAWSIGALTPGTRRRSATMGLTALVGTQLAQTLAARRHSPLVLATTAGSAAVLVGIVQTPGISHFFGCTPLGPLAWTGVLASTGLATAASSLLPAGGREQPTRP
jgi:cation-transporting ATPase I